MSRLLEVTAAGHRILADTSRVLHIRTMRIENSGAMDWNGRQLPVLDLTRAFGGTAAETARPIFAYGAGLDDPSPLAIAVDALVGFVDLDDDHLAPVPAFSPAFGSLFEAVTVVPVGASYLLRLRSDLDRPALAEAGLLLEET